MIQRIPIGWRLTLGFGLMSLFFLLSFSWNVQEGLWRAMRVERVRELERRAKALEQYLVTLDEEGELNADTFDLELSEFSMALPEDYSLRRLARNETVRESDDEELHTLVRYPLGGGTERLVLSLSLADAHAAIDLLRRVLLPWALVAAVASLLAGYWLVWASLRPVRMLAEEAQSIGLGELRRRVTVPTAPDELRTLARRWNDMLGRLDMSVSRLRRFTADASHELRTPLAVIRMAAEVALRRDRPAEEYRAALERIHRQADNTTRMVADLLDLARADEHAPLPLTDHVNLTALIEESLDSFSPLAEHARVPLEWGGGAPMVVTANETAVRRVLSILLENGIAYGAPGPLRVACKPEGNFATITFSNPANRLTAEQLPHLFDRFWRGESSRNRSSGGTGLGLAIAQEILAAHQGTLSASLAGDWLTITARFPSQR